MANSIFTTEAKPRASSGSIFSSTPVVESKAKASGYVGPYTPAYYSPAVSQAVESIKTPSLLQRLEDLFKKEKKPSMEFRVGEGLDEEQTTKAYETINKPVIPVGQDIKLPFVQAGVKVPNNAVSDLFKTTIEAPEKATRSLSYLLGLDKKTEDRTGNQTFQVPSYAEIAGKTTGDLIDEGYPPVAAAIFGATTTAGAFAGDALMFAGLLESGAQKATFKATGRITSDELKTAHEFLGNPKTLEEARANFLKIQKEFHPDLTGGSDAISKQANNAYQILQKEGIPSGKVAGKVNKTPTKNDLKLIAKDIETPKTYPKLKTELKDISKDFTIKAPEVEGINKKQASSLTRESAAELSVKTADKYMDLSLAPVMKEGKAVVIGSDNLKDFFGKDYNPNNHQIYSQAADQLYRKAVPESKNPVVKFTVGGTGSGKSDFLVTNMAKDFDGVVYDSTGWNYEGLKKQIDFAKEHGKTPEVTAIIPDLKRSRAYTFERELNGLHPVSEDSFIRTHSGAIETLRKMVEDGVNVKVLDTRNIYSSKEADQAELLTDKDEILDLLDSLEYSKDNVKKEISEITKENARTFIKGGERRTQEIPAENRADQGLKNGKLNLQTGAGNFRQGGNRKGVTSLTGGKGLEGSSHGNSLEAARRLSEHAGKDGEMAELVVRRGEQIQKGERVKIDDTTLDILQEAGFGEPIVKNLKDGLENGGVTHIIVNTNVDGNEFVSAFINDTVYLNPDEIDHASYKDGTVINHEVAGHSWYKKLSDESRASFYEDLKNYKEEISEAWKNSDNPHIGYWEETIRSISQNIANNSSQKVADRIISDFGLDDIDISLDSFIDQSLNIDKTIEAINTELARIGKAPLSIQAHNTIAIQEHIAMIAEKSIDISPSETIIGNYVSDINNGTLKYGPTATKSLVYQGEEDISTTILEKLKGRDTVSKQFIQDLTNSGDLKQVERDLVRDVLTQFPDKIPVAEFAKAVKAELLPLQMNSASYSELPMSYENISLPDELHGNVANYDERIYESPIKTSAGEIHFSQYDGSMRGNYFGHTRIEDMAPSSNAEIIRTGLKKGYYASAGRQGRIALRKELADLDAKDTGNTRRVIEVQSDLYQKGNLEKETQRVAQQGNGKWGVFDKKNSDPIGGQFDTQAEAQAFANKPVAKLQQYNDPTAHFRMIREEVKKAAIDGKTKLQFPTGETAMKIEGLGGGESLFWNLKPDDLKVGNFVEQGNQPGEWVVTEVLGNGKFKAIPADALGNFELFAGPNDFADHIRSGKAIPEEVSSMVEQFSIADEIDTNNPIYKFYEKEMGRYLKNRYGAERITDDKGVSWYEVKIKPEMATEPVIAFRKGTQDLEQLRRMLERNEQSLEVARSLPEQFSKAYGPNRIKEIEAKIADLRARIREAKNPTFNTGSKLDDLKLSLDHAEKRVALQKKFKDGEIKNLTSPENIKKERGIPESKIDLSPQLTEMRTKINGLTDVINVLEDTITEHPGKKLQPYISKKLGAFADFKNPDLVETESERIQITERNKKVMGKAMEAFAGTKFSDEFDNPDTIRESIDDYRDIRDRIKELQQERLELKRNFYEERKQFFTSERDRLAVNGILEREHRLRSLQEVEKLLRKEGLDRKKKVDSIQEYFALTDKEMAKVKTNPDFRLLSDKDFENYLKGVEGKAYEAATRREMTLAIENTIQELELRKVENLREALKLRKIENMSMKELEEFDDLLNTFQKGDEFLGKRQIQTVRFTDMAGIKTKREALDFLAKEAGVHIETMKDIRVKEFDKFLYDTALARKNPLYKVMVDNVNLSEVQAGLRFQEIKIETNKLLNEARKSRKRGLLDRLIPTDHMIWDYLSGDAEVKKEIAARMTPQEYKAATYIQEKYAEVRDYLVEQETLKRYITNYVTHIRRDFLESWKESSKDLSLYKGFKNAVTELFDSYKQDQAVFNILDQKTGDVLPLEKFFKFSMQRSGNLVPSKNVGKAFLEYMRTFEKKRQFDSFIPKLDIFAHVLTPSKMTPRGLEADDSLKRFVKMWINSKKGRVMDTAITPGGKIDWAIRSGVAFTRLLDLGLNIPVGLASNVGEQAFNFIQLGPQKYAKGIVRFNTKKGAQIIKKYESLVGEKFLEKMRDSSKDIGDKFSESFYLLFSSANRRANAIHLLAEMTPAEFKAGELSDKNLAEIRSKISEYHVVGGTESLYGKTPLGLVGKQYKTWAIPAFHTTINNLSKLSKMAKEGKFKEGFKSQAGKELMRSTLVVLSILLTSWGTYDALSKKRKRTFLENLAYKSMNDALSLISAMNPALFFSEPRLVKFLADLTSSVSNIAVSLTTNTRTNKGDIKGLNTLKSTLTPALIRQIGGNKEDSELSSLLSEQNQTTNDLTKQAEDEWAKLKKIEDPAEQIKEVERITKDNPALTDKITDIINDEALGLTDTDKKIKALYVKTGARAKYIYDQYKKMKEVEQLSYIEDLINKKIISDEVAEQLAELIANGIK